MAQPRNANGRLTAAREPVASNTDAGIFRIVSVSRPPQTSLKSQSIPHRDAWRTCQSGLVR